jgi:uncharacterized membrane protein YkvA (DUF1232 family)
MSDSRYARSSYVRRAAIAIANPHTNASVFLKDDVMTASSREPLIIDATPERVSREEARSNTRTETKFEGAAAGATTPPRKRATWKRAVIGVLALLYVLSPLDIIPDVFPIVGWLDDIGVLAWAARQVFFGKRD